MIQLYILTFFLKYFPLWFGASLVAQLVKNLPAVQETWVGDLGLIPGLGRSPGEGNGYPLQYSGLENSMDCINPWGRKQLDTTERLSNIYIVWGEWCWVVVAACRLSLFAMNGDYSSRLLTGVVSLAVCSTGSRYIGFSSCSRGAQ